MIITMSLQNVVVVFVVADLLLLAVEYLTCKCDKRSILNFTICSKIKEENIYMLIII